MQFAKLEGNFREKSDILKTLISLNENLLADISKEDMDFDKLDPYMDKREEILETLSTLDEQFDEIYAELKERSDSNVHPSETDAIRKLVEETDELREAAQKSEARTRDAIENFIEQTGAEVKEGRINSKAAMNYYKIQSNSSYIDPQFMDSKK